MNFDWLLFSHEGRLNRQPYLILILGLGVLNIAVIAINIIINMNMYYSYLCSLLLSLLAIMPNIKRLHDRDRSGWFILFLLIPIANIWIAIELCFFKGTNGDNKYGANPLAVPIINEQ